MTQAPTEHHQVVVVGGGQAGLSLSWHLCRAGIDHVVLERAQVAHEWSDSRWDNFTLVTPNWQCRLPGFPYTGPDPDGFMPRDAVVEYLRAYAASFDPPVVEHTAVTALRERPGGGFSVLALTTSAAAGADPRAGRTREFTADQVVIATGGYHRPVVPALAERLPSSVHQLHSSRYRSAADLPAGSVLVVGSGQSGAQIAEDLQLDGRHVHLAVGGAPRVARTYRGRDCVAWLQDMGHYDRPVAEHQVGTREKTNHYVTGRDGGRDIDLRVFARQGMDLWGRLLDFRDDRFTFAPTLEAALDAADAVSEGIKDAIDLYIRRAGITAPTQVRYTPTWRPPVERTELSLSEAGITSVVWAMGFRADYRWVDLPTFDGTGQPRHHRGVSPVPGLFFLGLPWLHTWGSGRFASVARDAEYLAEQIAHAPAAIGVGSALV